MLRGESLTWSPIPELVRQDGDLTIVFLSGDGVQFVQRMDDDWYRATTPWSTVYWQSVSGRLSTWRPDVSASPMGCLEQFQWCNSAYPRDRGCGPLGSFFDALFGAAPFFNFTYEDFVTGRPLSSSATSARLIWPFLAMTGYPTTLPDLLGSLGIRSLASESTIVKGYQLPLPENQWQSDVLHWWHIILAALQASRSVFFLHNGLIFCCVFGIRCSRSKISQDSLAKLSLVS